MFGWSQNGIEKHQLMCRCWGPPHCVLLCAIASPQNLDLLTSILQAFSAVKMSET